MKYCEVLTSYSEENLERYINEYAEKGYELRHISTALTNNDSIHYTAIMVRSEAPKDTWLKGRCEEAKKGDKVFTAAGACTVISNTVSAGVMKVLKARQLLEISYSDIVAVKHKKGNK